MSAELSVCVVSYNSVEDARRALQSIYDVAGSAAEVIVIDNASTDGTPEMIASEFPSVTLLRNESNEGYAPAMNRALAATGGRFVMSLSQDAALRPAAVTALAGFMTDHPEVGLAGPRTIDRGGRIVTTLHHPNLLLSLWAQIFPLMSWLRGRESLRRLLTRLFPNSSGLTSDYDSTHEAAVLDGGCLIVRREALEKVGLLDPRLMQGPDDYDWCFRMHAAGFRTWYIAEAEVVHNSSPKEEVSQLSVTSLRTRLPQLSYLYSKYHGGIASLFFSYSAWLLNLKWRIQARLLYGRESAQLKALREAAPFCLHPDRYARDYVLLWSKA